MEQVLFSPYFINDYLGGQYSQEARNIRATCRLARQSLVPAPRITKEKLAEQALLTANRTIICELLELRHQVNWYKVFLVVLKKKPSPALSYALAIDERKALKAMIQCDISVVGFQGTLKWVAKYKKLDKYDIPLTRHNCEVICDAAGSTWELEDFSNFKDYLLSPTTLCRSLIRHGRYNKFGYLFQIPPGCLKEAIEYRCYPIIDYYVNRNQTVDLINAIICTEGAALLFKRVLAHWKEATLCQCHKLRMLIRTMLNEFSVLDMEILMECENPDFAMEMIYQNSVLAPRLQDRAFEEIENITFSWITGTYKVSFYNDILMREIQL